MAAIESKLDSGSDAYRRNRDHMLGLVARLRALEARTRDECDEHTSEILHLITKG